MPDGLGSRDAVGTSFGNGREFISLRLRDSASALEVIHPLGYQVRVTGDVNLTTLRQVLQVLDERRDG